MWMSKLLHGSRSLCFIVRNSFIRAFLDLSIRTTTAMSILAKDFVGLPVFILDYEHIAQQSEPAKFEQHTQNRIDTQKEHRAAIHDTFTGEKEPLLTHSSSDRQAGPLPQDSSN